MTTEPISVLHLLINASFLVQAVMALLMLASFTSWMLIVQRALYQFKARRGTRRFEQKFWSGGDLTELYREGNANKRASEGMETIFRAGFREFFRLRQQPNAELETITDGTHRAMRVALTREREKLEASLPFLASVASVSPYIGLFGTVWGIMNAFRGLANQAQVTLASVAPGISEALIATAMGLFAAIPAVLAYNRFTAQAERLMTDYETFAEEFFAILQRQAHSKMKQKT